MTKTEAKVTHAPTPEIKVDQENGLVRVAGNWVPIELVVRAVNAHEALLRAARIGLRYMTPEEKTIYGIDKRAVERGIAAAEAAQ